MTTKHVLLIGHPNAGKTTLFNQLTGASQKTVNYPGSTVDFFAGKMKGNSDITLIDVPGISSLKARSADEKIAIQSLVSLSDLIKNAPQNPDLIVAVLDSTQRSRHLALAIQLIQLGLPVIVVMNMADLAKKEGKLLDKTVLREQLEVPLFYLDSRQGKGLALLKRNIEIALEKSKTKGIVSAKKLENLPKKDFNLSEKLIRAATKDQAESESRFDPDSLFLHWLFGPLFFAGLMTVFFYSIFALAAPLIDAVDGFFGLLIGGLSKVLPSHFISQLFTDGLLAGLGATLVFVPQIAILFLGIGLMESSGYLARGAVIVDRFFSKIGLSGRSFVPLLSGAACAIPALMAARNIPRHKERLLCMFVIPLMQCSARLPVFGLLLAMLYPNDPFKSGLGLTSIYFGSVILTSVISAIGARIIGIKEEHSTFNIELPQWRPPMVKHIFINSYQQTKSFVMKAGPIIIIISVALWILASFPSENNSFAMMLGQYLEPIFKPMGVDWRVGVAIILSFAAREVFVSALVVIFGLSSEAGMIDALSTATFQGTSELIFTTPTIIGLILFFMVALQCGTTVAVARKEMGNWKWPLIQLVTYIGLAYLLAIAAASLL